MKIFAVVLLLSSLACVAQNVPVVELKASDAARVQATHETLVEAQKAWDDLQKDIERRYLVVPKDSPEASDKEWLPMGTGFAVVIGGIGGSSERSDSGLRVRKGWETKDCIGCSLRAFEWGSDYRFLVMGRELPATGNVKWDCEGGLSTIPAIGRFWNQ